MRLILYLLFLTTIYGCFGDRGCVSNYLLETPLTITPTNGILNVGDTLHVSMITDNTMLVDLQDTGRLVNFANYDPFLDFYMPGLDTLPLRDGLDLHEIIIDSIYDAPIAQGSAVSDWIAFKEIIKGELESRLEFKVVMREKGIFGLYAFPLLFHIDRDNFIAFEDRCGSRRTSSLFTEIRINEGDSNEDLLSEHNKEVEAQIWDGSENSRKQSGIFYFKVE